MKDSMAAAVRHFFLDRSAIYFCIENKWRMGFLQPCSLLSNSASSADVVGYSQSGSVSNLL